MINLFLSLILILIALPLYANPCQQMLMGGTTGTAAPPAACTTQTTPSDMETDSTYWANIGSSNTLKYTSSKIIADATTGTVCKICPNLDKVLSPTMDFSVQLWANECTTCDRSDDKPDKDIILADYGSMNAANIAGTFGDCFSLGSVVLANTTVFHVVIINNSAYNATNYFRWIKDSSCTSAEDMKRSSDGVTWYSIDTARCGMVKLYKE